MMSDVRLAEGPRIRATRRSRGVLRARARVVQKRHRHALRRARPRSGRRPYCGGFVRDLHVHVREAGGSFRSIPLTSSLGLAGTNTRG